MNDWLDKIHAHADGELDGAEAAETEARMSGDPSAAAEHQWAVYIKDTLRNKHVKTDCSDAWREVRVRLDAIDALSASNKIETFVGRFSWGFAAALFAIIIVAGLLNRGGGQMSEQQLAGLFMASTNDRAVSSTDDADSFVRREFGKPLPQIQPVVEVIQVGKGRLDSRNFLKVDMVDNVGRFELYIVQGSDGLDGLEPVEGRREFYGGNVNQMSCVAWAEPGITYVLVAPRTIDEMVSMADSMKNQ